MSKYALSKVTNILDHSSWLEGYISKDAYLPMRLTLCDILVWGMDLQGSDTTVKIIMSRIIKYE